ncbi:RNA polymerase sigma factor SigJ [Actinoplanes sp. CA-030573]|uniref:RNA polymerase sigma factor SigJ n=1 Tax=Actinoplanes sp. CA-030573 TaxID=3239898 RepID=UPI003D92A179
MTDPGLAAIMSERRQLINLAYRLLGSLADAEDVVQETYARWYAQAPADRDAVGNPGGWLTRVAGRICLDQLKSARARRERYVGAWLPEPVPSPGAAPDDPADRITLDESVSMAFLVVLEEMTPAERVAFVLHDVFGYPFAEVAEIVGRTPVACRRLASTARKRIAASHPGVPRPGAAQSAAEPRAAQGAQEQARVVRAFKRAWEARDIGALVGLLDPDAVMVADGGGQVRAALRPIEGADAIARYAVDLALFAPGLTLSERTVNGRAGIVAQREGNTAAVIAVEVADGRITRIWAVRNPEKLRPWLRTG